MNAKTPSAVAEIIGAATVAKAIRALKSPTTGEASAPPPLSERCMIPPEGWWCSRQAGHEGPCAARPINPAKELCDALYRRFDDEPDFLGHEAAAWIDAAGEALQRIHRYALAAEGVGYDLILSVTERFITSPTPAESGAGARTERMLESLRQDVWQVENTGEHFEEARARLREWESWLPKLLAALASSPTEQMREALEPFIGEIDRLEREYGFDRPLHQYQPLMLPLSALLKLRQALGGNHD